VRHRAPTSRFALCEVQTLPRLATRSCRERLTGTDGPEARGPDCNLQQNGCEANSKDNDEDHSDETIAFSRLKTRSPGMSWAHLAPLYPHSSLAHDMRYPTACTRSLAFLPDDQLGPLSSQRSVRPSSCPFPEAFERARRRRTVFISRRIFRRRSSWDDRSGGTQR